MSGFDPFTAASPRWYAVPAYRPFLEDLAAGVLAWLGDLPPETLSDATILLPNRRAARAFTGALSKLSQGRPILLPQVQAEGAGGEGRLVLLQITEGADLGQQDGAVAGQLA